MRSGSPRGRERDALLVLEDGTTFEGTGFGAERPFAAGEVVFNTGMTGYQEVLTDPSYRGQIVTMTYPHIGNYGLNRIDTEGARPHVAGFVIRDLPVAWSSWRGEQGLDGYLREWGVAAITEIDTRRLTRHLRSAGAMRGAIAQGGTDPAAVVERLRDHPTMVGADLVAEVTAGEPYEWPCEGARFRVAAYDFGIKTNILRQFAARGCAVTVYPASTPPSELLAGRPDGVFLSNGPGDPEAVRYGIAAIGQLLGKVPVFGICLGHQLLGLALGLPTFKLAFGHHGSNHPVARLADGRVEITTQNHGFAVAAEPFGFEAPEGPGQPLPAGLRAQSGHGPVELTHVNLNDYTVEGFTVCDEPAFAVQYHPEAGPGPHDPRYLFDDFCKLMGGPGGRSSRRAERGDKLRIRVQTRVPEGRISWVALDAMGVIYEQRGVSALLASFAGRLGVPVDPDVARGLYRKASLGGLSSAELWEALGIPGPERDGEFLASRMLMPGVREFLAAMHREGVRVGCITNDVAEWALRQRRRYGLEDGIGPWVVSGEVGVRKPAAEIYERFLAEAGCDAGDCMFIDDTVENLDAAAALGFRTLRFPGRFDDVLEVITELHTVA